MEGLLQALMVTTILVTLLKTTESTLCSRTKDFTLHDPNNPDAQETCKRCQTCPPGQGLVKQCGSKVPYGTFTGCKPCVYNETYSDKKDTSHCKPCNQCGLRTVLQRCTPWQNSRCAATCRSGYIMDPVVDECKVVPENKTTASPLTSRNSTNELSGMMASSDTKSPGTTSPTVSTSGITATNSTPVDSSIRVRFTPLEDNQSTDQDSKDCKNIKIIVGCTCGAAFTIIILAAFGIRKCRSKSNIRNFEHHEGTKLQMKELQLPPMGRSPMKYHSQALDKTRTPLLGDQSNANSNASLSENLQDNPTKVCAHKNVKLDVQHIPEDVRISAIEKLRDHDNQLMLFYVQEELDFHETREVKTWYSIGQALNVDGRVLDGIETSYRSQQSPMRKLIQYLKTKGEEEPSMRDFVNALLQCKRYDVAENICNCPWPLTEAELERQSPEKYNMFLRDKETKKRNGETTVGTGVGGEGRVFRRLR